MGYLKWETVQKAYTGAGYKVPAEPQQLLPHNPLLVQCAKGHEFKLRWNGFKQGDGCKFCTAERRKQDKTEEIRSVTESEGYTWISGVYEDKKSSIALKCPNGHLWRTNWHNWIQGNRCSSPPCYKHKKKTHEEIASAIGHGLTMEREVKHQLLNRLYVSCNDCRFLFTRSVSKLLANPKCPKCMAKEKAKRDEVSAAGKVRLLGFQLLSEFKTVQGQVTLRCPEGHEFIGSIETLIKTSGYCRHCNICKPEKEIAEFLNSRDMKYVARDRGALSGTELDFYLPSHKLAIEHCGLYRHSEIFKDKNAHLVKMKKCHDVGIELITIFGDEWENKRNAVTNFISSKLGVNRVIAARKLEFCKLDSNEAKEMLKNYHIQGHGLITHAYGLKDKFGVLYMVMTFGPHHRNRNEVLLTRMCTVQGWTVQGGASKLFANAMKAMDCSMVSTFADLRYSQGNVYTKMGFKHVSTLGPDYSYTKGMKRVSKQSMRKRIGEIGTERELRQQSGWLRIYDCGKIKFCMQLGSFGV